MFKGRFVYRGGEVEKQVSFANKREGCVGHEVALPFDAEFSEAEKGLLERSETRSKPDPQRSKGTPKRL